jgi:hypothetical protein
VTNRTLLILSAALVVLVAVVFLAQRAETPQTSLAGERLLPDLASVVNDVERLEIVKAQGERVATLERRGERWSVSERESYPADFSRIRRVLLALAEARVVERATANPQLYERLGVEDVESETAGGAAITLRAAGREPISVIVGDAAARGYRYVRPAGEAQSYLIDRDPELPHQTASWLDPVIIDVAGNRVAEVTITHADGEILRIFKDERQQANFTVDDVPEGRELQYPGVANVLGNALRELRLEDVARTEEGTGEDGATSSVFRTFDGLIVTARGVRRNGDAWVSFFAEASATGGAADGDGDPDGDADTTVAADLEAGDVARPAAGERGEVASEDALAEAETINARVAGWRYRIAAHQFDQITRRMEDLRQAASAD